jgi:hypothetical protein
MTPNPIGVLKLGRWDKRVDRGSGSTKTRRLSNPRNNLCQNSKTTPTPKGEGFVCHVLLAVLQSVTAFSTRAATSASTFPTLSLASDTNAAP